MAQDLLKAQELEKNAGPGGGNMILGMISASQQPKVLADPLPVTMLSGIDAMERIAAQEAMQRASVNAGEKRKYIAMEQDDEFNEAGEQPRKAVRDADEIDI